MKWNCTKGNTLISRIANRIMSFLRDPFWVNRDFESFREMSAKEIRQEFHVLLTTRPCHRRFQRLCSYIALMWVHDVPVSQTDGGIEGQMSNSKDGCVQQNDSSDSDVP